MAQVKFLEITERYVSAAAPLVGYFISPDGSDTAPGDGTEAHPWATIEKFHTVAAAGDTCYMRGGTYTCGARIFLTTNGSGGQTINLYNYPGESPVLDFASHTTAFQEGIALQANYWHLKGFELKNNRQIGINITGDNNLAELLNVHHCVLQDGGAGIMVSGTATDNLVLNCDSYSNGQNGSGGNGTSGDGIAFNSLTGTGNIARGCRTWWNNDDGYDLSNASNVLIENCWTWENGYVDGTTATAGNGVGFKLGLAGSGGTCTVQKCLAWRNKNSGFDDNSSPNPNYVYNCSAKDNARVVSNNYAFYSAVANVVRNCLADNPDSQSFHASVVTDHNSWQNSHTVTDADFLSVDSANNKNARKTDGSLPDSDYLHLAGGSDLIDAGVDVGLSYNGTAPDIGAFESV